MPMKKIDMGLNLCWPVYFKIYFLTGANYIWRLLRVEEKRFYTDSSGHMVKIGATPIYGKKQTIKNPMLWNQKAN